MRSWVVSQRGYGDSMRVLGYMVIALNVARHRETEVTYSAGFGEAVVVDGFVVEYGGGALL